MKKQNEEAKRLSKEAKNEVESKEMTWRSEEIKNEAIRTSEF